MSMKKVAALILVAAVCGLAGCPSTPKPYEPQQDCPKQVNCGQCASQSSCGWCGNQCVAVGKTDCSTPIIDIPDDCPPPTADTPH
jgi:uncharacterized protein YceK